jgi:hypothetical protein
MEFQLDRQIPNKMKWGTDRRRTPKWKLRTYVSPTVPHKRQRTNLRTTVCFYCTSRSNHADDLLVIPYVSDEQADGATKNPQLKLLFNLLNFTIIDQGISDVVAYHDMELNLVFRCG